MSKKKHIVGDSALFDAVSREISALEAVAGTLPSRKNFEKYKDVGAVWAISGGGSYLAPIIDSPSDRVYAKKSWYPGQDKARLDYAKKWLDAFSALSPAASLTLIYNGTKGQNTDLLKAIDEGIFDFPKSQLYIAPGEITKTLEQVKKFSFPPSFKVEGAKLAVLSHSAHLVRILRFMAKFPEPFKNIEIVPLAINVPDRLGQQEMIDSETDSLLRYIMKGEATEKSYPFE